MIRERPQGRCLLGLMLRSRTKCGVSKHEAPHLNDPLSWPHAEKPHEVRRLEASGRPILRDAALMVRCPPSPFETPASPAPRAERRTRTTSPTAACTRPAIAAP